jgi:tripartite-type tricarboxylate transporter receptor subunit TctC
LGLVCGPTAAQSDYPNRPIKLWHGFGAGGNADTVARLIAMKMSEGLGQPVLVDAKTGAGGNLASDMVAKMPADGYNLILLTGGHAVSGAMYKQLPFDPVTDFTMVSTVMFMPFVIGTSADSPIKTVAELIEAAKKEPGKLSYSSVGVGSTQHLAGELFSSMAGVDMIHVPYRGGAAPVQDVMTQRVTVLFDTLTPTTPHIRSGKLRALGVTSRERAPSVPEVPSAGDSLPNFEVTSWLGVAAPAKRLIPGAATAGARSPRSLRIEARPSRTNASATTKLTIVQARFLPAFCERRSAASAIIPARRSASFRSK